MTTKTFRRAVFGTALALVLAAPPLAAQRQKGMGEPRYDPSTEATITGTVSEVQSHQGRMNRTGLHLILTTAAGTREVHVGPASWLADQQFTFSEGEALQVIGSAATLDGAPVILARQIVRGTTTITLRNAQGVPEWARSRGRRQS